MNKDYLQIEVLNIFYKCFVKALLECCMESKTMKIISEEPTKQNSQIITIMAKDAKNFYYLGKKFATYRAEI